MNKNTLIAGAVTGVAGLFFSLTGIGAVCGIPLMIIGALLLIVGVLQS